MTPEDERAMRSDLLRDVVQAQRAALELAQAVRTTDWVRDPAWTHKPSDDFGGCVE